MFSCAQCALFTHNGVAKEHKRPYHDLKRRLNFNVYQRIMIASHSFRVYNECTCTYREMAGLFVCQVVMMALITMMITKGTERPKIETISKLIINIPSLIAVFYLKRNVS